MIETVTRAWDWFVSGVAEALLLLVGRLTGSPAYRVVIDGGRAAILAPDGAALGQAVETEGRVRLEPDDLVRRLAGSSVDIMVPPAWLFRRDLDPVAVQSVPFLDAFVRHQIERITPWRAADVHYVVRHVALPADPQRVAVHVSLVPRRLIASWAAAIEALKPRRLRILPQGDGERDPAAITLGDGAPRLLRDLKPRIGLALGAAALCLCGLMGWLWWQAGSVRDEIAEQDRLLGERKALLARAHRQDQGERDINARLRRIRDARRPAVEVIEALAKALPDSAHLTGLTLHKAQMSITGVSADTSLLVPALERSGPFTGVAFGASITRVETGPGDRFQLDLSLRDPASNPPAPSGSAPAPP